MTMSELGSDGDSTESSAQEKTIDQCIGWIRAQMMRLESAHMAIDGDNSRKGLCSLMRSVVTSVRVNLKEIEKLVEIKK